MTRSPIIAVLALALLAARALACGNGECDPPPASPPNVEPPVAEPPSVEPPPVEPPAVEPPGAEPPAVADPQPDDRDPPVAAAVIHYGFCCQIDGKMRVRTAWLRDPDAALEQCRARQERLQSLPECPRRIRERAE